MTCSPAKGTESGHKPKVSAWSAQLPAVEGAPIVPTDSTTTAEILDRPGGRIVFWRPTEIPVPDDNGLADCIERAVRKRRNGAARLLQWKWQRLAKEAFGW